MSNPFRTTRRSMMVGVLNGVPASHVVASNLLTDRARTVGASERNDDRTPVPAGGVASVRDFGAVGDAQADDSAAFQAAIQAAQYLFVPPGRYRLKKTVKLRDGQRLFGTGKSAWEPYNEKRFPDISRSEILIDGILAFDAAGTNSAAVEGIAIKAAGGRQSRWGWPSGKQSGAIGFDITGSTQFEARDISFHGLEIAVDSNQRAGSSDTQMPAICDWTASDCGLVFRFGNAKSTDYTVRDARIADCTVTAHCDSIIEAHRCDGLRLENLRLFHGRGNAIRISDTPFVTISAVTIFETGEDQVLLRNCLYVSATGLLLARAGGYKGERPYPQRVALTLEGCNDVRISGQIQQPTGKAVMVGHCANIRLDLVIGTPFWMTGNQNVLDGAVTLIASDAVNLDASFGGSGADYWLSVWADLHSAQTLSGSLSSNRSIGVARAVGLQRQGGYQFALPAAVALGAGELRPFKTIRCFVPAGKSFKARSVEIDVPAVQLCISSNTDEKSVICDNVDDTLDSGGAKLIMGSITTKDHLLYDNGSGPSGWYSINLMLRNPTQRAITIPADTRIALSTVIV